MDANNINRQQLEKYQGNYSESSLFGMIGKVAKKVGIKLIYAVLLLFYVLKSPKTPAKDKRLIIGALGYFISPIDIVPDFIPIAGFSDDMAVLIWALKAVWDNVTPEVTAEAKSTLRNWFPSFSEEDLKIF